MHAIRISAVRLLSCVCLAFVPSEACELHAQIVMDPCDPRFANHSAEQPEIWGGIDTIFWYALAPFSLTVPEYGEWSAVRADSPFVLAGDGDSSDDLHYVPKGAGTLNACADYQRGKEMRERCWTVMFLEPKLERWESTRALKGVVGSLYTPQTDWADRQIPNSMYQTIVEFDGVTVFDRSGTRFDRASLPKEMTITSDAHEIRTRVYWKPGGTQDRSQWKLIFTNYEDPAAYITPSTFGTKFEITYPPLFHAGGFSFEASFSSMVRRLSIGPIVFHQFQDSLLGASDRSVTATCAGCAGAGIDYAINTGSDSLFIDLNLLDLELLRRSVPAMLTFSFTVTGKGGMSVNAEVDIKAILKSDR